MVAKGIDDPTGRGVAYLEAVLYLLVRTGLFLRDEEEDLRVMERQSAWIQRPKNLQSSVQLIQIHGGGVLLFSRVKATTIRGRSRFSTP